VTDPERRQEAFEVTHVFVVASADQGTSDFHLSSEHFDTVIEKSP
jgi:hypothetical protein